MEGEYVPSYENVVAEKADLKQILVPNVLRKKMMEVALNASWEHGSYKNGRSDANQFLLAKNSPRWSGILQVVWSVSEDSIER